MNHILKFFLVLIFVVTSGCSSSQQSEEIQQEIAQLENEMADQSFLDDDGTEPDAGQAASESEGSASEEAFEDDFADDSDEIEKEFADEESAEPEQKLEQAQSEPAEGEGLEELQEEPQELTEEQPAMGIEPEEPMEESMQTDMTEPPVNIENIEFLANKSGGTIVIQTSAPTTYKTRSNVETNQFIIEVENANLSQKLKRPYILKEFRGASFASINAYQGTTSQTARIVVQLKRPITPIVQAEGSSILILPETPDQPVPDAQLAQLDKPKSDDEKINEVLGLNQQPPLGPEAPDSPQEFDVNIDYSKGGTPEQYTDYRLEEITRQNLLSARTLDEFLLKHEKFYGKPVSIQVFDAGIKDVLNFISEEAGLNMVISDQVSGKITVKLRKVPWDQALILIMKTKGLGYIRQGNVIRIAPIAQLEGEKLAAKLILEQRNDAEPLQVKIIPISFADIGILSGQIQPFLSSRGKAVTDQRTSSIIITDVQDNIVKAEKLINELDVAPFQVLIEGKIVEAVENFSQGVGINWLASGAQTVVSDSGGLDGGGITVFPKLSINPVGKDFGGTGTLSLEVGTLEVLGNLNATISLLEQKNLAKVISSPRIITLNREGANFNQTLAIPYVTATVDQSGGAQPTVSFQNLSLSLNVTPQVTADESVIMSVSVTRTIPTSSAAATGASATTTSAANTKVLVKNNQSAVIGGIYTGTNTLGENRVPTLANIPVLGWLFKSRSTVNNKTELIIFVTPRIIGTSDFKKPKAS